MFIYFYLRTEVSIEENYINKDFNKGRRSQCADMILPYLSFGLQILVKVVPIKEGHKLRILWPITPAIRHYKEAPSRYLAHLIGHEGEGSLFYILKTLGWFFISFWMLQATNFHG